MDKIIAFLMSLIMSICTFLGIPMDKIYSKRTLDNDMLNKNITERINTDIAEGKLTGAEAIVNRSGEEVFHKAFGKKSVDGDALAVNSLFRIASMTKPVTAAAVLLEAEKGHIDLNADVSDYLDGFKNMSVGEYKDGKVVVTAKAKNSIKVYQLLSHSSGMASGEMESYYFNQFALIRPDYDISDVTECLSTLPLAYDPGTAQAYSTIAFDVAARIVEITSGQDFETYVRENIFDKLGMNDTAFHLSEEQWSRMTAMHNCTPDGRPTDEPTSATSVFGNFPSSYIVAGGGLASTAADYSKFAEMLLNNGKAADGTVVMQESSVELMRTPWVSKDIMGGSTRWGLGVIVYTDNKGRLPKGSFGWSGAYGTHFFVDPADNLTAIYMKNSAYEGGAGCRTANNFEIDIMNAFNWNKR